MGIPHQILAIIATADALATTAASLNLGLLPVPQVSKKWLDTLVHVGSHSSVWERIRGKASATITNTVINVVQTTPPRKLLFVMLAVCLARCSAILTIWSGVVKTVNSVRAGAPGEDLSGSAIGYSAVCIVSMLVNLSVLNLLFQTHGLGHYKQETSVQGILKQMDTSSLAAEQLIISAVEWILFVIFMGTNRSIVNPSPSGQRRAAPALDRQLTLPAVNEPALVEVQKKKDYGALSETPQPVSVTPAEGTADVSQASATGPSTGSLEHPMDTDGKRVGNASLDSERNASTLATTAQRTAGDVTPSDIMDVPSDRKQSMQDARDRLQRARDNGKVRRRSLWKKIRGKTSLGGSSNAESQS